MRKNHEIKELEYKLDELGKVNSQEGASDCKKVEQDLREWQNTAQDATLEQNRVKQDLTKCLDTLDESDTAEPVKPNSGGKGKGKPEDPAPDDHDLQTCTFELKKVGSQLKWEKQMRSSCGKLSSAKDNTLTDSKKDPDQTRRQLEQCKTELADSKDRIKTLEMVNNRVGTKEGAKPVDPKTCPNLNTNLQNELEYVQDELLKCRGDLGSLQT